jgi:hypothetical protein
MLYTVGFLYKVSVAWFGRQKEENELPEIRAYAPGIYARSEELVQATRDLDRGRTMLPASKIDPPSWYQRDIN